MIDVKIGEPVPLERDSRDRFAFGENWTDFLGVLTEERISMAERSLTSMLAISDLHGRTFLDAGCGSGLFSLAAARLHAEVVCSIDLDDLAVSCAQTVRTRYGPADVEWSTERGDILDPTFRAKLGGYDVVYCWGVVHHTGAMWSAIDGLAELTKPGGLLFFSVYNDQGPLSVFWKAVKRTYNRLPRVLRTPFAVAMAAPGEVRCLAGAVRSRSLRAYGASWHVSAARGMSRWHDVVDWVGGYPFEVAKPQDVIAHCEALGLQAEKVVTVGRAHGCNQFVFSRGSV